ncbi:hypothetical protein ARMGADRAFT_932907 [Armillaria gallica]|uniref:Tc1-like transposase DDE domain-containing protein n=1 Tax=Armillaria gallica TaxID=47427 RepID=A0A2H3DAS4_ARMGA|nr:hypothetical protein ARMGADRAFT_932907 [Armillaria gallica]
MILYLPPYSPDLNPIEESFSTCMPILCDDEDPILVLLDACGCITAEMALGWFQHAGYIF